MPHYTVQEEERVKEAIVLGLQEGSSLRKLCSLEGMPDKLTVLRWSEADNAFATRCARARIAWVESEAESLIELADNLGIPPDHKKYMISTRQWYAAKIIPKVYGDRLTVTNQVDDARAFEAFGAALADAGISEEQTAKVLEYTAQHLQALK